MKTTLALLTVATILLAACTPGVVNPGGPNQPVACPADAKLCPDGSAVGRIGPNCEFAACSTGGDQPGGGAPDQTPPDNGLGTFKEYKSQSPGICQTLRFTCDGGEFFSDETGCGCIQPHQNAAVTTCSTENVPVCGWNDQTIQCFAYPCASMYRNICLASVNEHVAYTTPGQCPPVGGTPPADNTTSSGDGKQYFKKGNCTVINFMCLKGMKAFVDDQGCGCEPDPSQTQDAKLQATDCTDPRPQACTMEYNPVCGQKSDGTSVTYGNKCTACGDASVLSWVQGACASQTQNVNSASTEQSCTAAGGKWDLSQSGYFCNYPTTDAGKSCNAKEQCQGQCVPPDPNNRGSTAMGTCDGWKGTSAFFTWENGTYLYEAIA